MLDKVLQDALIIWATIDPLGTLAIFTAATAHMDAKRRKRTAYRTVLYAGSVLLGAMVVGQFILNGMGIRMISFQVAGGLILFLFGIQMTFGSPLHEAQKEPDHDIAVFPLAIPATATPGAILAAILLTDNNVYPVSQQALTAGVMVLILAITLVMLLLSNAIIRVIGFGGASILTRIMGMVLAAFSVELVMDAIGAMAGWLPLTD